MASAETIKRGSKGYYVQALQAYLNKKGYNLTIDGDFGPNTEAALKDYQQKNGLTVDGIAGPNTWGHILSQPDYAAKPATTYTPTPTPELLGTPTLQEFDKGSYGDSDEGKTLGGIYDAAKESVFGKYNPVTGEFEGGYGDFSYKDQWKLDGVKNQIANYGDFSYDVNSDALYQQYADQYTRMGDLAMQDTMGQAAALTGGYGSSYATTAGAQAYQSYLQQLNDKVPELAQMAEARHNQGLQNLYNQYGMYTDDRDFEFGKWQDGYQKLLDRVGVTGDDYYKGADMFYTEQGNKNDVIASENAQTLDIWQTQNDNIKWGAEWAESLNQYADTVTRWEKDYELDENADRRAEEEHNLNMQMITKEFDDSSTLYSGIIPGSAASAGGPQTYNNGTLTKAQVKELQVALGVNADGYYGKNSSGKAGGLSANEAYQKYVVNGEKVSGNNSGAVNHANFKYESVEQVQKYCKDNNIPLAELTKGALSRDEFVYYKQNGRMPTGSFSTGRDIPTYSEITEYNSYADYEKDYIEYVIQTYTG